MDKPVIGITSNLQENQDAIRNKLELPAAYLHAVLDADGIPAIIPTLESETTLRELYERVDGLVLIGGSDVSPHFYRKPPHPSLQSAPTQEDFCHLSLARWAAAEQKPFLAICRGHQILNVALGGTLIQDIPGIVPDALQHTRPDENFVETFHPARIDPNSRLAEILGCTSLEVNSSHHQAVEELGRGLIPTAWAPDLVLEAMELRDHPYGISVQWHPERIQEYSGMSELFSCLIQASRKED
ncbi:MAG: gamma-glutamyl-gamma-aminobutyrate hydrolase family protein [Anaerolineales bacterium]|nr:gamma-glutamyl-gamma-aminobutyrate hydrolase family protein [Anaerolineales bacterium]